MREYIMSTLSLIKADLDSARRNKDSKMLTLLTTLFSEASMIGKTKRNGESTEEEVLSVLKKFKAGVDQIVEIKGLNEDLSFELDVYNKYLPSMLTAKELESFIDQLLFTEEKNMGVMMSKLKSTFPGRYDGALASKLIKERL